MTKNEHIIRLQDLLIKNYKKEIDLLKEQNMLLRETVDKQKQIIKFYGQILRN